MLQRIWALLIKEILAVWRDKKSRIVLVMPPLIQLFLFAWAGTLDIKNVSMAILNLDNGAKGFELVQRFHGAPVFANITYLKGVEEIAPYMDNQKGLMVLHIDELFSRNLESGQRTPIQIILDGRKSNAAQIIIGYVNSIVDQYNQELNASVNLTIPNAQLITRSWFNPNLLYYWYNVPCLCGILSMIVSLMVTALSIARERELGTFDQLLVSPMLPLEILAGKALPAMMIGIAEGSLILLAGIFVFQVPFTGSIPLFYFSMLVFVCSIVGIGLFISSICSTQQQAILGSFLFMSPSILISGFATPIENMPQWLQYFTHIVPLRYFLVIAKGSFLKAIPYSVVLQNTWPMAIIACFTLGAATWLFRHRLE